MNPHERINLLSDATDHLKMLSNTLKSLGGRYANTVDILGDILSAVEIDEAMTEIEMRKQWEREQFLLSRSY